MKNVMVRMNIGLGLLFVVCGFSIGLEIITPEFTNSDIFAVVCLVGGNIMLSLASIYSQLADAKGIK